MTRAMEFVSNIRLGISIGDTLDARNHSLPTNAPWEQFETAWGKPVIQEGLIDSIINSGMNLIRFPISWSDHLGPAPEFRIEPSWLNRVKEVVDYAYKKGAYIILNLHHEDWNFPYYENESAACIKMKAVWSQLAEQFQDYDTHLIFEAQNEPRKIGTPVEWTGGDQEGWDVVNATNRVFVETIRNAKGYNKERFLMLPGYGANCTVGIRHIDLPKGDDRIIISVHAYEPYDFALNMQGRDSWNQDTKAIDELMQSLKELYTDKGVPVIIGEFGAMNKGNEEDRRAWAEYYTKAATKVKVKCVWWDNGFFEGNGERFGLFNRYDFSCVYPDILDALLKGTAE